MPIYRALSVLLFPFIELYLFYRVYKKKEDKKRLLERFGRSTIERARGAKVFLVNARLSEKSAKRWSIAHAVGFNIFENFEAIFAQSEEDKNRLSKLTKKEILLYGNLKAQARDLSFNADELTKLKSQIGPRKFWLAASTHKGEEEIILQVHQNLKKDFPDLLTILIPRHPNRAEEIKLLFSGINLAQRSSNQNIENSTEIYLADTLGELGTFYRLANFTFLG